jgi:polyisoprenoid-binding protein YceI
LESGRNFFRSREGELTMRRLYGILTAMLVIGAPVWAADTKFTLTGDNTTINFVGSKANGKHEGGFKALTGTATANDTDPTTLKVALEIDLESIYTDDQKLTAHLKSPDFFNVKTNPKARFVSTRIEKDGAAYKVTGDLTLISGTTKSVTFPANLTLSADKLDVNASFKINRNDFGITYGKGIINDDVALTLKVKATK